jgi:hypothetical protein
VPQKKKQRRKSAAAAPAETGGRKTALLIAAVLVVAVAGLVFYWVQSSKVEAKFLELAAAGQSGLSAVQSSPSRGRNHLQPGQGFNYGDDFPTSGDHAPVWTEAGVYSSPQPKIELVHALEHGNIVIYTDDPGEEVMKTLEDWAGLYSAQWSGIVIIRKPGLGSKVVLSAWTKRLFLDPFDPAPAAAFIDTYRGRGPEHPVR